MLKKRILASSLASVMALSSVSVVAFADETTTDISKKDAVSLAELKEYIKSFDDFVKKDLEAYGDIQTKRLNDAIAHAQGVVDDSNATEDQYVAAFQMLKAVANSLHIYTTEELKELIASCKAKYETKNVLNEALSDVRWTIETWDVFEDAYEDADRYIDSDDGRIISDAYCMLEEAVNGLKEEENVTKSDFRTVYNQFENIISKSKDYESWRRGICTATTDLGGIKQNGEAIDLTLLAYVEYGQLLDIVYGASEYDVETTAKDVDILVTQSSSTGTFLPVKGGSTTLGFNSTTKVEDFVKKAYDVFTDKAKATNKSSQKDIVSAYKTAKAAVEVFNGWKVDNVDAGNPRDIKKINDNNRAMLLKEGYADTWITALIDATKDGGNATLAFNDGKVTVTEDAPENFTLTIDKRSNCLQVNNGRGGDGAYNATPVEGISEAKAFKEGDDVTKYIPINQWTIEAASTNYLDDELNAALVIADAYYAEELEAKADRDFATAAGGTVDSLVENDTIKDFTGSYAEYALIYRNLKYVYDDINAAFKDRFTKSDVEKLIADADKLIEKTADASFFSDVNTALVNARKTAKEWVATAKVYAGYKTDTKVGYTATNYGIWNGSVTKSATDAYLMLKKRYDACMKKYNKYPYSYGEVAETLAKVGVGLESGAYEKNVDTIRNTAAEIAYKISILDATGDNNEPFNEDRNLIVYNRVFKEGTDAEKALYAKYNSLIKLLEEIEAGTEDPTVVKGDLDGDNVATAKDALMIVQAAVGLITLNDDQKAAADFNNDGKVNSDDALAIVKAALGLN